MFENRREAGRQLAERLAERGVEADIVLGVPRGGLPVAREVAAKFDVPLDIVVAKKMGAPGNPEFAIGAAASDGSVYLNDEVIERLGVDEGYIEEERARAAETAEQKAQNYREGGPPDLSGKSVLVVDDGIATGATAIACLRMVSRADAQNVVLAVPVGSPRTVDDLHSEADDVVVVDAPAHFSAVGQFYRDFSQVTDEEARRILREFRPE